MTATFDSLTDQQREFRARISRIESGVGASKSTVYVGLDESYVIPKHLRERKRKTRPQPVQAAPHRPRAAQTTTQMVLYPLYFLLAAGLGFLAFVVVSAGRFHLADVVPQLASADLEMLATGGLALMLALLLTYFTGVGRSDLLVPQVLGVVLGIGLMHNAVHLWPAGFDMAFSANWVGQTLASTERSTFLWRGAVYSF